MAGIAMAGNCLPGRASKKERTHARHNYNKKLQILLFLTSSILIIILSLLIVLNLNNNLVYN